MSTTTELLRPDPELVAPAPRSGISRAGFRAACGALIFASVVCFGMFGVRALVSHRIQSLGLCGNLLLAWIPLVLAWAICRVLDGSADRRWIVGALFILWVLFFPNAPYIVTDLVHLKTRPPVPRWFDYIFMTAHAITGLFLAYLSLALLHARVRQRWGALRGWVFVFLALAASSVGVYVGRFMRWNSWDVLVRPWRPARDLHRFFDSDTLLQALLFWSAFFSLLLMVYVVLHALAHLHADRVNR